jgi:hypothetical protein
VLRFDPPPDYETEIAPDLPVFQPQAPKKKWHKQTMPAVSEDPYVRCLTRETDPGIEIVLSSGCGIRSCLCTAVTATPTVS